MSKTIYLYGDDIGRVDLIDHMGSDLTIVNSARVSFGVTKNELDNRDKKLIKYMYLDSLWFHVIAQDSFHLDL